MSPRWLQIVVAGFCLFLFFSGPFATYAWASSLGNALFVSSFTEGTITKIDLSSLAQTPVVSGLDRPEDGVCGPDGRIYFAESLAGRLARYDTDGTNPTPLQATGHPEGLAFDAVGNLFFNTRNPSHTGVWKI